MGKKSRLEEKNKILANKPFICKACREQLGHDAMVENVAGFCPYCGGRVTTKEQDARETDGRVERPRLMRGA